MQVIHLGLAKTGEYGLGNQLFQYTFCRISALKNKCNFFIQSNKIESIEFYSQCNSKFKCNLSM